MALLGARARGGSASLVLIACVAAGTGCSSSATTDAQFSGRVAKVNAAGTKVCIQTQSEADLRCGLVDPGQRKADLQQGATVEVTVTHVGTDTSDAVFRVALQK